MVGREEIERARDRLHLMAARDGVPSLVVLAALDGGEVFSFASGKADRERDAAAGADTVYGLGSVSKPVLALTAMHLVRSGTLDLHRPVSDVLGGHPTLEGVTAHHLLSHTSGLPPLDSRFWALDRAAPGVWSGGVGEAGDARRVPDPPPPGLGFVDHRGLLDYLDGLDITPLGPPGRWLSYSNEGYVLLAGLIAERCEAPYTHLASELVLEPLGLRRSAFIGSTAAASLDNVAVPYARRAEAELVPAVWWDAPAWDGPGGLLSSARDLLAFAEHLRQGAGGLAAIMAAPHAPTSPAAGQQYGYGLWSHGDPALGGLRVVGHSGGRIGTAADMAWVPDRGITAVALCNVAGGPAAEAVRVVLAALCGGDVDAAASAPYQSLPRLPRDVVDPARVTGAYVSGETSGGPALVVEEADGVVWGSAGGRRAALRPVAADRYVEERAPEGAAPLDLRFLLEGAGPAWGVAMGLRILTREPRFHRR